MTLTIISHPDCVLHEAGYQHPECPDRVKVIQAACETYAFRASVSFLSAPLVTREQLLRVHAPAYVDWMIKIAPQANMVAIDADTVMNSFTLQAAYRASGAVVFAVDALMSNQAVAAFCNVRPPGHHAERNKAMGFCFFNNVAVGVMHAIDQYQLQRIAIIDFDVHHGNGTQDIFQREDRVLYCSSFQHPFYPGYDPAMDNAHILSVPLPAGTDGASFREKVSAAWFEKLALFQPQLIFFSAGFDAHKNDPLAHLRLTQADYLWLTEEMAKIAERFCSGRMVSVLEGGYALEVLAECVPVHINAMIGR